MSTLRVDNIKSRTTNKVTIPNSHSLEVTGGLNVTGVTTYAAGASLDLQGVNVNSGTRGDILYYDSNGKVAKLNVGASGSVIKSDGTDVSWGSIGGTPTVYYVATNGVDAAGRGGSVDTAWKTIKYACSNLTSTPTANAPAIIMIKGGVYEELQLPIVIPAYTTLAGDSLRTTVIKPGAGLDSGGSILNIRSTLFRCSNAVIVQDLVCDGMGGYTPGSPAHDPTAATLGGIYFQLNAASVITEKSPYIYNVTTFGDASVGALVDGALHASGYKTMLFHTYTHISSDGVAIYAKDNGSAEVINCFSYYCQIGYVSTGGAQIRSLNSSNSYGEYGVFSKGYDTSETPNSGSVAGKMLVYTNVLTTDFTLGELITGGTSSATAYVINVQSEPKHMYIIQASGTFQAGEVVTGGTSGTTATLDSGGSFNPNQSGRILVTTFGTAPTTGDALTFASTDGNAYQIQSLSQVIANSVTYRVLVFSTSRATPVANSVAVNCRKRFSTVRLTGHDFLKVGTGDKTTTNWPGEPTQPPSQADQIVTDATDPGRVYYVATDELGNFYVGEYFKVDQATGQATLNSSAFNLTGLESLQLGAIGGLIGASINEFSTDGTMAQNSDSKCPTQAAVRTYVANQTGFTKDISFSKGIVVTGVTTAAAANFSGNVSIGGTLTYLDVTNVDSVGLVTARNGIHVGPSTGVGITFTPAGGAVVSGVSTFVGQLNAGTVTATTVNVTGTVDATTVQEGGKSMATMGKAVAMAMVFG